VSATAGYPAGPGRPGGSTLLRGLAVQGRVIHALILRELQTRFGRGHLGFLWLFLEPLILATAIGGLHYFAGHGTGKGVPIFVFYLIGYIPFFAFRAIINRASSAFTSNATLMYHRQVRLFDIVIARNMLEMAAVLTIMTFTVIGTAMVLGRMPYSVPALVGGAVLLLAYAQGLGLLAAAVSSVSEVGERLIHPLTYLSLPISGAFFTMHSLPPSVRDLMLWNPQVHLHEMMREGMFGDVLISYYSVPYMVGAVLVVNLLGMCAMRAVRPKLEF
jgi:capsular polysaccharide transport system permease protein